MINPEHEEALPARPTTPYFGSFVVLSIILTGIGGLFWPFSWQQASRIAIALLVINLACHLLPYGLILRHFGYDLSIGLVSPFSLHMVRFSHRGHSFYAERARLKVGWHHGYPWVGLRLVGIRISKGDAKPKQSKSKPAEATKATKVEAGNKSPVQERLRLWSKFEQAVPHDLSRLMDRAKQQLMWHPLERLNLVGRILAPSIALLGAELADVHIDDVSLAYAHARLHIVRTTSALISLKVNLDGLAAKGVVVRHSVIDVRALFDEKAGLPTLLKPHTVDIAVTLGSVDVQQKLSSAKKRVTFEETGHGDEKTAPAVSKEPSAKQEPSKIMMALRQLVFTVHRTTIAHNGVNIRVGSSRLRIQLAPQLEKEHSHRLVYGRNRQIFVSLGAFVGKTDVHFEGASHGLSMRESSLAITSTWLPPQLTRQLSSDTSSEDISDNIIVAQAQIGGVSGKLKTDELAAFISRRRQHAQQHVPVPSTPAHKASASGASTAITLPRIVAALVIEDGYIDTHFHDKGTHLGLRLPAIDLNVDSDYKELSHRGSHGEQAQTSTEQQAQISPIYVAGPEISYDPGKKHTILYAVQLGLRVGAFAVEAGRHHRIIELAGVEILASSHISGSYDNTDSASQARSGRALLDLDTKDSRIAVVAETLDVALWRPDVLASLRSLLVITHHDHTSPPSTSTKTSKPLVEAMPHNLRISASLIGFRARLAGPGSPSHETRHLRGIDVRFRKLSCEYILRSAGRRAHVDWTIRKKLGLASDEIADNANALAVETPTEKVVLAAISTEGFELAPIVDAVKAAAASSNAAKRNRRPSFLHPQLPDALPTKGQLEWELLSRARPEEEKREGPAPHQGLTADILDIPSLCINLEIRGPTEGAIARNRMGAKIEAGHMLAKVSMLHIYCVLAAIREVIVISPSYGKPTAAKPPDTVPAAKRPSSTALSLNVSITHFDLFITLPHNVRTLFNLRRLEVSKTPLHGAEVKIDSLLLAGVSVQSPGAWEDLWRIYSLVVITPGPETPAAEKRIVLQARTARLRIPYRYIVSEVIDNIVTMTKATKQLVHECKTGSSRIVIEPMSEKPKRLPTVNLTFELFVFEAEDDPLETSLNTIWRAGTLAQQERLQMQNALERKIEIIEGRAKADAHVDDDKHSIDSDTHPAHSQHLHHQAHLLSDEHAEGVDADVGRYRTHQYFATEWIRRVRNAKAEQERRERTHLEAINRRLTHERFDRDVPVPLLANTYATPLLRAVWRGFDLNIAPPSCGYDEGLRDFLYETGKMPRDMQYSLFVPVRFEWCFSDVRIRLRDYPLPIMHVPMPSGGLEDRAWRWAGDFVIAEELRDHASTRLVPCQIIPREEGEPAGVAFQVPRSAMPTKFFALPVVEITSAHPVKISWGNAMSPAMQDVARVFDTLSKVPPDTSERIGSWDKTRLKFHGNIRFFFDDNVPLTLFHKGTRDPYALSGYGAGFVMRWDGHVRILLGCSNPEKEFLQFESDRYRLGVPNLSAVQDWAAAGFDGHEHSTRPRGFDDLREDLYDPPEDKVVLELANGVRWGMRIDCERTCRPDNCQKGCSGPTWDRKCRLFTFKPHYEVQTRTAQTMGDVTDSYKDFRSDFVHFSISIRAPAQRNQSISSTPSSHFGSQPCETNQIHLSPLMSAHFWAWWQTFESALSLPIRQGALFPSAQESSKKFGKHTGTIKYLLSVAPLYVSHTYRKSSSTDWKRGQTSVIGLKGRADHFSLDMHQRAQTEVHVHHNRGAEPVEKTVTHKIFYQAELDCDNLDMRVISAVFDEPDKAKAYRPEAEEEDDEMAFEDVEPTPLSDEQRKWVNHHDYTDLHSRVSDLKPVYRIFPVMTCPHVTYYRQPAATEEKTDSKPSREGASGRRQKSVAMSKFGDEFTHVCMVGKSASMLDVRRKLVNERHERLRQFKRDPGSLERVNQAYHTHLSSQDVDVHEEAISRFERQLAALEDAANAEDFAESMRHPGRYMQSNDSARPDPPYAASDALREALPLESNNPVNHLFRAAMTDWERYGNRLLVHNPAIRITNTSRDILLGYIYSRRERKAESYQMTASAIKQVRDLAQAKAELSSRNHHHEHGAHQAEGSRHDSHRSEHHQEGKRSPPASDATDVVEGLVKQLAAGLASPTSISTEDGGPLDHESIFELDVAHAGKHLNPNERLQNSFVALFIAPQISLRSEVDNASEILVGAWHATLKVFSVLDQNCMNDPVNQLVRHSSFGILKGLQVYCPRPRDEVVEAQLPSRGFIPTELILDEQLNTLSFDRLMPAVDCRLRYDKYNPLRIAHSHDESGHEVSDSELHDRFGAECLRFLISANPAHYTAIYNIVTDLILYTDPTQKLRSAALESVLLVDDFANLSVMADRVRDYQTVVHFQDERIRILDEHATHPDENESVEIWLIEADRVRATRNLRLLIEAITASQSRQGKLEDQAAGPGLQMSAHAEEIEWDMQTKDGDSIAQLIVSEIDFAWRSKKDGSVSNELTVGDLTALNAHDGAAFPEILAKLEETHDGTPIVDQAFCNLLWSVTPPVGGINVVEKLELNLHPIRLAIEHQVGRLIMDYVFTGQRNKSGEGGRETAKGIKPPPPQTPSRSVSQRMSEESTQSTSTSHRSPSPTRSRSSRIYEDESVASSLSDLSAMAPRSSTLSSATLRSYDSRRSSRLSRPSVADLAARYKNNADGLDVAEMRRRRALYRAFIYAVIDNTTLNLSYKNNGKSKLPDLYGLSLTTPSFVYRNQTLSYLDLLNHVKKDITTTAWKQSVSLVKQVITHARKPGSAYIELGKRAQIAQRRLRTRLQSLDWAMDARSPTSPPTTNESTLALNRSRQRSATSAATNGSANGKEEEETAALSQSTSERMRSPLARAGHFFRIKGHSDAHPHGQSTTPLVLGEYATEEVKHQTGISSLGSSRRSTSARSAGTHSMARSFSSVASNGRHDQQHSPDLAFSSSNAAAQILSEAIVEQREQQSMPTAIATAPLKGAKAAVELPIGIVAGPHSPHHLKPSEDDKARLLLGRAVE